MVYLISYDLDVDNGNYAAVKDVIQRFGEGNYCQCLLSAWLVFTDSNVTAKSIFETMRTVLGKGDRCFINSVTRESYWGVTTSSFGVWQWLDAHL